METVNPTEANQQLCLVSLQLPGVPSPSRYPGLALIITKVLYAVSKSDATLSGPKTELDPGYQYDEQKKNNSHEHKIFKINDPKEEKKRDKKM